jgi:hypothetical protein
VVPDEKMSGMQLDLGSRLGYVGLAMALFGIATQYIWPDKRWIGWICFLAGLLVCLIWGISEIKPRFDKGPAELLVSIFMGCVLGGIGGGVIWSSMKTAKTEHDALHPNSHPFIPVPPKEPARSPMHLCQSVVTERHPHICRRPLVAEISRVEMAIAKRMPSGVTQQSKIPATA